MNNAQEIITTVLKGKNIMTPSIIQYGFTPCNLAYELSEGTGFNHKPIYGVTFIDPETMKSNHELNQMFYSLNEAKEHIKEN